MPEDFIKKYIKKSCDIKESLAGKSLQSIIETSERIFEIFERGNKLLLCGNGGSAADCQHFATELMVRLSSVSKRKEPLSAISLTTNTSLLTACSNDMGFDEVFARQVRGLGVKGDALFAISTSGNSPNVLRAAETAREMGIFTISLTGNKGGKLKGLTDLNINVEADYCPHIQESHICIMHILCELVEQLHLKAHT